MYAERMMLRSSWLSLETQAEISIGIKLILHDEKIMQSYIAGL